MSEAFAYTAPALRLRRVATPISLPQFLPRRLANSETIPAPETLQTNGPGEPNLEGFTLLLLPPQPPNRMETGGEFVSGPAASPGPGNVSRCLPYPDPSLTRRGVLWLIQYKGEAVSVKNSSGMPYLVLLLQNPGRMFHVVALVANTRGREDGPRPGSAGEVLDAQAISDYRERLKALEARRDRAAQFHDLARVEVIEEEMDLLKRELRSALGLGGRTRQAASDTERLRKTVSKAITRVIAPLHASHPGLGRHLSRSLHLGKVVSYVPGKPVRWRCQA